MANTESIYLESLLDNIKKLSDSEITEFLDALTDDEKISFEEKVDIIKDHIYNRNIISNDAASIIIGDETIKENTRRALSISNSISNNMTNFISSLMSFFKNDNNTTEAVAETNFGNLYNFILAYADKKIIQLPINTFSKYHTWAAIRATKYNDEQEYYLLKDGGDETKITDFVRYRNPENDFSSYYIKTRDIIYNKVITGKYNKHTVYYKLNSYGEYEQVSENDESNFTNYYTLSYEKATNYNKDMKYFKLLNGIYTEASDVIAESFTDYYIKKSNDKFEKATSYNVNEKYYIYIRNFRIPPNHSKKI